MTENINIELVHNPIVTLVEASQEDPFYEIGKYARFAHNTTSETFFNDGYEILKRDVFSVAEQIHIDIECRISERLARQINRHRHMAIVQKSTRYNSYTTEGEIIAFHVPQNANHSLLRQHFKKVLEDMRTLQNQGVDLEEVNYLLPLSTVTNVRYHMNLRTLIHMCNVRLCRQALPEFNEFLEAVKAKLALISPSWRFIAHMFLIPHCATHNDISCVCPDKKCDYKYLLGNNLYLLEEMKKIDKKICEDLHVTNSNIQ